ncbi:hypothetical protein [Catelliglobosispora koreensis]|uniref:hypothetical protein n=1 Tax=Catelliglobosispora koreensis TaxID=129052 RepID=UPI00037D2C0C|nr:hypothetical protein [Catelliglobosispora koreensis]
MSLTEQEAADLRDIAMRVRSRHREEGGDVGAHTVALAVAKLLDENERLTRHVVSKDDWNRLRAERDLIEQQRDKLYDAVHRLITATTAVEAARSEAGRIMRVVNGIEPDATANSQDWEKVGASWEQPSQAVVSEAVAHAVTGDDEPTVWEQHPAFMVLYGLYKYLECPGTVDGSDPEDRACVASASVKALMDAGILTVAESTADGPEQTDEAAVMPS